jgi:nucleotide-binding universal stress UspA family protein
MSIKHILAPLTGTAGDDHVPLCALHLVKRLGAHVTAGFADVPETYYAGFNGVGGMGTDFEALFTMMAKVRQEMHERAYKQFSKAVKTTNVPVLGRSPSEQASTEWLDWKRDEQILALGPNADLAVVNVPGDPPNVDDWVVVEDILFRSRRPAIIVPSRLGTVRCDRPIIAWNGSREAANAVGHALDLFEPKATVRIIQVGESRLGSISTESLIRHLGWHGFKAETFEVKDKSRQTAELILKEAKRLRGSLLVMGAYTHSRTREKILGGVTDFVLKRAKLPVLLAH